MDILTIALCMSVGNAVAWLIALYTDRGVRLLLWDVPFATLGVCAGVLLGWLVVCFAILRVLLGPDASPLLVIGGAVLMSALLSLVLLKGQRDAFAEASLAKADQRRADRQARRSRLDDPDAPRS